MTRRAPAAVAAAALAAALAGCSRAAPPAPPAPGAAAATTTAGAGDEHAGHAHAAAPEGPALCAHGVPAELCTRCDPDLAAVFKSQGDWCAEHGVPESQCLKCNPGLTFAAAAPPADWCAEHAVPESRCTKCKPGLVAAFVAAGDYCREHGLPESACPHCHPERVPAGRGPPAFPPPGLEVRLASADTVRDAGIATHVARPGRIARELEVVGQLDFDQNRLAQLTARGEALVLEVRVDVGDEVAAGQVLAVLRSAAVGADQARLQASRARVEAARAAVAREEELAVGGLSPRKSLDEARRELAEAEAERGAARSSLGAAGASGEGGEGRYALRAPFAGTVVSRDAVAGRSVGPDRALFQVADLRTVWAQLEVPEAEAPLVRPGQPVTILLEGHRGPPREGRIARVAPSVDPASRTVRARVELPNADRTLRAGTFVRARIAVTADREALLVPREAIQRAEGRALVFVKRGEGRYAPVAVTAEEGTGGLVEVVAGLAPGAEVVTTGAFLLKTEIMKESIGAGCSDHGERP